MDLVPASDEEDILFPAPVAAPKGTLLEDPYSFESLVGMYTALLIMFTSSANPCLIFRSCCTTSGHTSSDKAPVQADHNSKISAWNSVDLPRRRIHF